ncbi:adenosylhomocysteinase [Bifidobacterium aemilianum]|uniref:Adenosylhomocysteinase n=2 Tax=Bifidobacterium aemilianum TaxID=2493120 RepID=A0A366KAC4_9BIFI|nr:adenosylhomocysteinase [Bifidobacterium aemilianum]
MSLAGSTTVARPPRSAAAEETRTEHKPADERCQHKTPLGTKTVEGAESIRKNSGTDQNDDENEDRPTDGDSGRPVGQTAINNDAAFDFAYTGVDQVTDMREQSGTQAMAYAQEHMPILHQLMGQVASRHDLSGTSIAVCLILEPKTAVLLRELAQTGARVGVCCESGAVDQRVADQLKTEGILVQADASWNEEQARQGALDLLDQLQPNLIIDDGASFARLASRERPDLAARLVGVAEETTSGVRAFEAMEAAGALTYPVIAVNDSQMKTGFDNAHGTGESCVTTMQEILGSHCFAGTRLTVIGYGPVGEGFAKRVRALGAQVTVCDSDPRAALKAVFDGFPARNINQALPQADMAISATGVYHTIALEHMRAMRPGALLAVIGGIANEIALDQLPDFHPVNGRKIRSISVPDGPELTLLAEGDGVNYTAGGGNPIEIMDLSFAVQAAALAYLLDQRGELTPGVHRLPESTDRHIASLALAARGYQASQPLADHSHSWQVTRFDHEH